MITNPQTGVPVPVVIVAGMSQATRAIGNNNELLWHVPDDLKRFKQLTLGHPIIMGRKTFESIFAILGKPLPGRTNIVVTHNPHFSAPGTIIVPSLEAAFAQALAENPAEIHIGGGAYIYDQALPFVDRLHLTFFYDEKPADTFFPDFSHDFTEEARHGRREHAGLHYEWVDYSRLTAAERARLNQTDTTCLACEG